MKLTPFQKKRIKELSTRIKYKKDAVKKEWKVTPLRLGGKSRQVMMLNGYHFWIADSKEETMQIMEKMK